MFWLLSGVCAAAVGLLIAKLLMDCAGGDRDDEGDDDGVELPERPRYDLRTRPTLPGIDLSIYHRY